MENKTCSSTEGVDSIQNEGKVKACKLKTSEIDNW